MAVCILFHDGAFAIIYSGLCLITMPYHKYVGKRFPINLRKFGSVVIFCVMCSGCYLCAGVWKGARLVRFSIYFAGLHATAVVFAILFVYMERNHNSPYFLMDVFKLRSIRMGILLFLLLMIFNSSAMFVSVFAGVGMKIDRLAECVA